MKRVGKVSYLVDLHDKPKRRRVFHVNMPKEFRVRRSVETSFWAAAEATDDGDDDEDVPLWDNDSEGKPTVGEQLSTTQQE